MKFHTRSPGSHSASIVSSGDYQTKSNPLKAPHSPSRPTSPHGGRSVRGAATPARLRADPPPDAAPQGAQPPQTADGRSDRQGSGLPRVSCFLSLETTVFFTKPDSETPHLMMALPPVRPSDCSVVLCKAAPPVTCKEGTGHPADPSLPPPAWALCHQHRGVPQPATAPKRPGSSPLHPNLHPSICSLVHVCLPNPTPSEVWVGRAQAWVRHIWPADQPSEGWS